MKDKRKVLRPLGSGFAMAVPLFIGILVQDPLISSVGAMGAFSYLAFQHRSLFYNLRAILTHGAALLLAFIFRRWDSTDSLERAFYYRCVIVFCVFVIKSDADPQAGLFLRVDALCHRL